MTVVSLASGLYCQGEAVAAAVAGATGLAIVTDSDLIEAADSLSGMGKEALGRAFAAGTSLLARCTHEKEQGLAWLRLALASRLAGDEPLLLAGWCGLLVPRAITHTLGVCLIADTASRLQVAANAAGVPAGAARQAIERSDKDHAAWVRRATGLADPFDPALYDMVVPMDKTDAATAAARIVRHQTDPAVRPTGASRAAARDFLLAARVGTVLAGQGHDLSVSARNGRVTMTIHKRVLFLARLEQHLRATALGIDGVTDVMTKVGRGFYQSDIYRQADFERAALCLPDGEPREFFPALSDRLEREEGGVRPV